MPLSQASLTCQAFWALTRTNTGYRATTQGPESQGFTLVGLDVADFDQVLAATYTVATTATQDIDLTALTNLVYQSFGFAHVLSIMVLPTGDEITLEPGPSNGLVWFFGSATDSIVIAEDGCFMYSLPASSAGQVVDGTHKVLRLTGSGASTATVKVFIIGSTS
jgi:hypothetical protein